MDALVHVCDVLLTPDVVAWLLRQEKCRGWMVHGVSGCDEEELAGVMRGRDMPLCTDMLRTNSQD